MKQEMKVYKATLPDGKSKTIRAYNILGAAAFERDAIKVEQILGVSP